MENHEQVLCGCLNSALVDGGVLEAPSKPGPLMARPRPAGEVAGTTGLPSNPDIRATLSENLAVPPGSPLAADVAGIVDERRRMIC